MCAPFLYGGCGGNANNFGTLEECRDRCQTLAGADDAPEREPSTTELPAGLEGTAAPEREPNTTEPPAGLEGTAAPDREPNTTEPPAGLEGTAAPDGRRPRHRTAAVCFLPRDSGSCLSYAPMFYYDVRTSSCHQFIYRGCGGNGNRFHTSSECRQRCVAAAGGRGAAAAGDAAAQTGAAGEHSVLNTTAGGPNTGSDRPETDHMVSESTGTTSTNVQSTVFATPPATWPSPLRDPSAPVASGRSGRRRAPRGRRACLLRPRPGPCHHYLPQFYYYNAHLATCFTFIYGGCGGNSNRFATREECESYCRGVRRRVRVTVGASRDV